MWNSPTGIEFGNILRRVLDFRQLQQPKINLSLRLPWLSHPHYQRSTREVLRRLVLDHRNWALPFHLPSTKLAETPHPRVHTVMWNFSSFQDCYLLTSAGPSSCQCAAWLKRQPWLSHVQGHVAAGLDEFRFPGTHPARSLHLSPGVILCGPFSLRSAGS